MSTENVTNNETEEVKEEFDYEFLTPESYDSVKAMLCAPDEEDQSLARHLMWTKYYFKSTKPEGAEHNALIERLLWVLITGKEKDENTNA